MVTVGGIGLSRADVRDRHSRDPLLFGYRVGTMGPMRQMVRKIAYRFGLEITRLNPSVPEGNDIPASFYELWGRVEPFTMTSPERGFALYEAVRYIARNDLQGAIVECGVWRGGSAMLAALTLDQAGVEPRDIYLFDTFTGMPEPTTNDTAQDGTPASALLAASDPDSSVWAIASLDEVKSNFATIDYPSERVHFVEGLVEDTIPGKAPHEIAILRLDTDWYESTKHELEQLVPRLTPGGVLIIDDYGHWLGARRAVDEFLEVTSLPLLLVRVDYTGRIAIMPHLLASEPDPTETSTEIAQHSVR